MPVSIEKNITAVQQRLRAAEQQHGRNANSVILMAVSKTRPADAIRQAAAAGIVHVGENYLQEALTKIGQLKDQSLCWHFIGPIQSNKTAAIAEHFDWVHSVDRLKIAQRLSAQRPASLAPLNICLQVNISHEASKSGATLAELTALAQQVNELAHIRLRGLMAIPRASDEVEQQRQGFAALRRAFEQLRTDYPHMDTLSMGMSGDMEAAVAEGSTMVRIGSDIFGPRN